MDYGVCKLCNSTGYITFEKAVPEFYGDDRKLLFGKPCTNCALGRKIQIYWGNTNGKEN